MTEILRKALMIQTNQMGYQTEAYPGFCSMKQLGICLLPPGWDARASQGYPQHFAGTYLYTWVERGTTQCPGPGLKSVPLDPDSVALTIRPPHFHTVSYFNLQ